VEIFGNRDCGTCRCTLIINSRATNITERYPTENAMHFNKIAMRLGVNRIIVDTPSYKVIGLLSAMVKGQGETFVRPCKALLGLLLSKDAVNLIIPKLQ
jgi:hypothetical protein